MMEAAEFIFAEAEPVPPRAKKILASSAELVTAGAEMFTPVAHGHYSAKGAEQMAEAAVEMATSVAAMKRPGGKGSNPAEEAAEVLFEASAELVGGVSWELGLKYNYENHLFLLPE